MVKIKALSNQRGVAAIIVGVSMVMFLGFAALAVDLGYYWVTQNELQNVADAAALGAARQLGVIYEGLSYGQMPTYVCDPARLINVAREIAVKNGAGGKAVAINDSDVTIGRWNASTKVLTPTLTGPDAVSVQVRRDSSANGPISTFFAMIWGKDTMDVRAMATAALTGESSAEPESVIPVGISSQWFERQPDGGFCGKVIQFIPTSEDSCAGWNTYERSPADAAYLRRTILEGWVEGTFPPPDSTPYNVGDEFVFVGGNLAKAHTAFLNLFDYMKTRDNDLDPTAWTTKVVVYEDDICGNPHGPMTVAGFATAIIKDVGTPPNHIIVASVICDNIDEGRGGGGTYGTLGSIPGLVQ